MEEREEWDDEVKRSNEEVTCRVQDRERDRGHDDDGKRGEVENRGIWSIVTLYRYTYDIDM